MKKKLKEGAEPKRKNYSEKKLRKMALKELHQKLVGLDPSSQTYKDVLAAIKELEHVRSNEKLADKDTVKTILTILGNAGLIGLIFEIERKGELILPPKLMNWVGKKF